eukprot:9500860-Pyramimonas_sp.AAC.1
MRGPPSAREGHGGVGGGGSRRGRWAVAIRLRGRQSSLHEVRVSAPNVKHSPAWALPQNT